MEHGMQGLLDYVLVHAPAPLRPEDALSESYNAAVGESDGSSSLSDLGDARLSGRVRPVSVSYADIQVIQERGPVVVARNLVDPNRPTWHDPRALRAAFAGVMRLCRSPRR